MPEPGLRSYGSLRNFEVKAFFKNCAFCVVFFIIIPAAIYYMSYYPYGRASGMHGVGMYFTSDYANLVLDNQKFMFSYHSGVHTATAGTWPTWLTGSARAPRSCARAC